MNIPSFNAEAALSPTLGVYRRQPVFGGSAQGEVSMQQFGHTLLPGLFKMRCCRWAPAFRRFMCTERTVFPTENCTCYAGEFGPVIACKPPVFTDG
jgi:hypothetical protein